MTDHNNDHEVVTDAVTGVGLRLSLRRAVEAASGLAWDAARMSWRVSGMSEDVESVGECVCGQTGLRYLYNIADSRTGAELYPIGSDCIEHFGDPELMSAASDLADLAALKRAVMVNGTTDLKRDFTRRRLATLERRRMITPAEFEFLIAMFNRRREMTVNQGRWADSLMARLSQQLPCVDLTGPRNRLIGGAA